MPNLTHIPVDGIAHRETSDVASYLLNRASRFPAEHQGERELSHLPATDFDIPKADASSLNPYQDLTGTGNRPGQLHQRQSLRSSESRNSHGMHALLLFHLIFLHKLALVI